MFKNVITNNFNNCLKDQISLDNWDMLFKTIVDEKSDLKKVIVLDEFQYLGKVNPSFPSVF